MLGEAFVGFALTDMDVRFVARIIGVVALVTVLGWELVDAMACSVWLLSIRTTFMTHVCPLSSIKNTSVNSV